MPLLLSAKESFLPRKDLESWDCCWDTFLLIDMSEGERESLLLMDILEDVVGGFVRIVLEQASLNFEIKLNSVRLSYKTVISGLHW